MPPFNWKRNLSLSWRWIPISRTHNAENNKLKWPTQRFWIQIEKIMNKCIINIRLQSYSFKNSKTYIFRLTEIQNDKPLGYVTNSCISLLKTYRSETQYTQIIILLMNWGFTCLLYCTHPTYSSLQHSNIHMDVEE